MSDSRAVAVARAHVEAWSRHDFDTTRSMLADDVKVNAMTTNPAISDTDLVGADLYMEGLIAFAGAVVPGSQNVIASVGDDRNALLTLTVKTAGPPYGKLTLPGARMYLINEDGKIQAEQVIFYAVPD